MSDPRRPTLTHDTRQQAAQTREVILDLLLRCTDRGCSRLGCTGVSFVTMAMGLWAAELSQLHGSAAAKLMRALADMFDPESSAEAKDQAELDRSNAARELHVALDLLIAQEEGAAWLSRNHHTAT